MKFDIVRGKISKPEQIKQLVGIVNEYMKKNDDEGTLYLGYPLTANKDEAVTIDALLVTKNKGMIAFICGNANEKIDNLKEQQDLLYYHMDYYLKNYNALRKGRGLAFEPLVITIVPIDIEINDEQYFILTIDDVVKNIEKFEGFDKKLYRKLCEILQKVSEIKPRKPRNNVKNDKSYGGIIKQMEKEIANLDQWQKKAAFEIPEGPQRIRGLAGSGKTIVLALKAAYLHTQYSEMKIAVTFYTRSLKQQYENLIADFVKDLSGEKVDWENLDIIHAWGSSSEKGIYSKIAQKCGVTPYNLTSAINKFGRKEAFDSVCTELLQCIDEEYKPSYDAILIDEAQDMPSSFFRLVYNDIKEPKRIIWAYDELQNLTDVEMPSLEEMFGTDENGTLNISLENQEDEAKRDIVLPICYRNPPWTLALAHALGFGIYHKPILQMFESLELWKDIGYSLKSGRLKPNNTVTLSRKNSATPEYFEQLLDKKDSVIVKDFDTKSQQYLWVVNEIIKNIEKDELDPDDILVVFPDTYYSKSEYKEFDKFLFKKGINSILAGVNTSKDIFREEGSITCSHIYRAKGNEAPMVYIVNSEYCSDGMELTKLRNILFTAITRSRAWVRICGIGDKMNILKQEIDECIEKNNYDLKFKIPTEDEMIKTRKLNRERTKEEKDNLNKLKNNISEMIEQFQKGEIEPELIPELQTLINMLNAKK